MTDRQDPPPTAAPDGTTAARPGRLARLRRAAPFGAGIVVTLAAIAVYGLLFPPAPGLTRRDVADTVDSVLASQTPGPPRSELVFDAVRPSLVLIEADRPPAGSETSPAPGGIGSGVVVNEGGQILTALHVVADATRIHVRFADGSETTATVAASEPETDIAVLEPAQAPPGLVPATLGNPGAMRIGSEAFIVGNPFGLYGSLSAGVVSGLGRSFRDPKTDRTYSGLIQVDAAVNPGNSGGPLLDRDGRVVGIVTALINPTREDVFIGIGLAVPIDVAGGAAGVPQY